MLVFCLLLLAAAASASSGDVKQPCSSVPANCHKQLYTPACSEDDEDCHGVSGSGSGEGSGKQELKLCRNDDGKIMELTCGMTNPTSTSKSVDITTTQQVETKVPASKTRPVPGTAPPRDITTTTVHDITTTAGESSSTVVRESSTTIGIVTSGKSGSKGVLTSKPSRAHPKTTTAKISTEPSKDKPSVNDKINDQDNDDGDKTWMIGVIIGCVIGSAILGVLAAVVVIKLKFSGQQSGSYHANERGSTGSSSSQKPLYV